EIVVGKLLGRSAPVVWLTMLSWPFLCFVVGYSQAGGPLLVGAAALTLLLVFALGSASIWVSLRSKQTREAVLYVYFGCALAVLGVWGSLQWGFGYLQPRLVSYPTLRAWLVTLEDVFRCLNPLYVLQPAWASADPGEFARRLAVAFFAYGS